MKKTLPAFVYGILWAGVIAALAFVLPSGLHAQPAEPIDTVQVLAQPGSRAFECCYTFIVSNRHPSNVTISEFRVRIISGNEKGMFLPGQGGSPIDWSIFLSTREVQWLSETFAAEIDSGESLTSFRVCVRDTGVYRMVWETRSLDGILSQDTLVLACSGRDNCDEAFIRTLPSNTRCGFDIDLLSENGDQKVINDFHLSLVTPGFTIDTVGSRVPAGWRIDRVTATTISWKTASDDLSYGEFAENFRIFFKSNDGSPVVRVAWWTTSFGDVVCRDSVFLRCGLTAPDTLYAANVGVGGDTCCRDYTLINTHVPRTPLKSFRLVGTTPATHIAPPADLPRGWTATVNNGGDTLVLTIDTLFMPGDTVRFSGICFESNLSGTDTARYLWRTEYDDLHVTQGTGTVPCFRRVVFCDSVSAFVDTSLIAVDRCITLTVANRNSRADQITKVSARISNPGKQHTIVRANPPAGWSVEEIAGDSIVFHRGIIGPGLNQRGFEFCVDIDTAALDPMTIKWTTWATALRPLCSGELEVEAEGRRDCDSVVFTENSESINPLCCFDVTFYNRNERSFPITSMQLRLPSIDLIFDSGWVADAGGTWRVANSIFPSITVDYVGDTLEYGESVTFRFCVNAAAIKTRPTSFPVVWRTYSRGTTVCFDTVTVVCHGKEGECDSIVPTREQTPDGGCIAYYAVGNMHTPVGPIDNVQFSILSGEASFVSGQAIGSAAGFSQVSVAPKRIIFRGDVIQPGEAMEEFHLNFDASSDMEVVLEICTFEGDQQICCVLDTVQCSFLGVDDDQDFAGALSHSVTPNPFDERTEFRYEMSRPGGVTLVLLDQEGREVRRYNEGIREAGTHTLVLKGDDLPSGVYYYILQAGAERGRGKVVLVK